MSSIVTAEVTVSELSKYGFRVNEEYINYSKTLSETEKGKIVPGLVFTGEFYVADSSKRYLNKVLSEATTAKFPVVTVPSVVAPKAIAKNFPPVKPKVEEVSKGLSKDEWASKDTRISRQGLIQASLIALAPVVALDVLFDEAVKLADKGLAYVNAKGV